ncbi:hypothetical protein Tco_1129875 [Tanacetum coccineum]
MPPTMTTQSAGGPTVASRGRGTGGRAGRGGGRTRGRFGDQDDGRIDGQDGQVGGQGSEVNDGVNRVLDFSTIIAQQLNWKEEELLNEEVSSDDEWEKHKSGNPPNDSFPKPYLNINNEKDKNHYDENNKHADKLSGMDLSGAPQSENINNEQPKEGICRVEKFEVIKYMIGGNEEFLAICTRECDSWARTVNGVSSIYHDIFRKKDKGWTIHRTK